jgi:hypothetical protein
MTTGECCICGSNGKLTFDHVPPRAAFNDRRVFEAEIDDLLAGKWIPGEALASGRYIQSGAGRHSLCAKCNNDTGTRYGAAYVDFARLAMILLHRSNGTMKLAYPYGIFPLRVLKQIVVMFFSTCGPSPRKAHPDLVGFVLNRSQRYFPQNVQIWAYLHDPVESISTRQSGVTGMMKPDGEYVFSEIAFPPFALIMSFNAEPVRQELCNLTHFHLGGIDTWDVEYLKMLVLPVVSFFPGDFRTATEIQQSMTENHKLGSYFLNTPLRP